MPPHSTIIKMEHCRLAAKAALGYAKKQCRWGRHLFRRQKSSVSPGEVKPLQEDDINAPIQEDEQQCKQVVLSSGLVKHVAERVLGNRDMKSEVAQVQIDLAALEEVLQPLSRAEGDLEYQFERLKAQGSEIQAARLEKMEADLELLAQNNQKIESEKRRLENELKEIHQEQHEAQADVFDLLDKIFVEQAVIPKHSIEAKIAVTADLASILAAIQAGDAPSEAEDWEQQYSQHSRLTLDLDFGGAATKDEDYESDDEVEEEEDDSHDPEIMKRNFRWKKLALAQIEADFEMRDENFEKERQELIQAISNEQDHTNKLSKLDIDQILETQKLARAFAKAEEELENTKQKALALGIDLADSDLSSGFVDDPNDGYRTSFEEEIIRRWTDKPSIKRWLVNLPETSADMHEGALATIDESVDLDDWDARTVDIADSGSMVAEGTERKRIDKWQRTLVAAAQA